MDDKHDEVFWNIKRRNLQMSIDTALMTTDMCLKKLSEELKKCGNHKKKIKK